MTWNDRLNEVFKTQPNKPLRYMEIEAYMKLLYPGLQLNSLRVIICNLVKVGLIKSVKPAGKLTFYHLPSLDYTNTPYKYNSLIKIYECTP